MAVTAAQISELRKSTGAGMLDCKKALEQTDGNFDQAVDFLRTKGSCRRIQKSRTCRNRRYGRCRRICRRRQRRFA